MSRHGKRYRQIADALARHGLGYLAGRLGIERFIPFHRGLRGHPRRTEPYTRPDHLRMIFEDLGATATKLGQILSTRPDLLPPDYVAELSRLQDAAPPFSFELVRATVEGELGRALEDAYASFDPHPLAAASVGQAHPAVVLDGTEKVDVVVKVRRPGVVEEVREDLEILKNLAASASRHWVEATRYALPIIRRDLPERTRLPAGGRQRRAVCCQLLRVFVGPGAESLSGTFDLARPYTRAPAWHQDQRSGWPRRRGIDRKEVADRAATMLLDMVFEHGLFHADPHPGNFFIQPGGCRDGEAKVAGPGKFSEWKAGAFRSASADARGSSLDQVSEKPSRRGPPIIVALDARSGGDNAGSAI